MPDRKEVVLWRKTMEKQSEATESPCYTRAGSVLMAAEPSCAKVLQLWALPARPAPAMRTSLAAHVAHRSFGANAVPPGSWFFTPWSWGGVENGQQPNEGPRVSWRKVGTCTTCPAAPAKGKASHYTQHKNTSGLHQAFTAGGSPAARPDTTFRTR